MISASMISDLFINGVGITLVNSLWQGLVVVLALKVLLLIVPGNNVQLKYWLSVTALCLLVFWGGHTLKQQLAPFMDTHTVSVVNDFSISSEALVAESPSIYRISFINGLTSQLIVVLQPFMPSMVIIWFIGVIFLLIRLQGSMIYLSKLKNLGIGPVPLVWQRKVNELSLKLGIRASVKIVESKLAEVPMVIGHLKPVILIPIGLLTGLPTHEVEAILAHELAHIRRMDYMINVVQAVIESLLFFNPAVWWISETIRKHREHCCDDIAVKYCGDQLIYANALSNLGAWSIKTPALGMGLFKSKNELLMRIKRLIYPQVTVSTFKEKLVPGTILLLTVVCLSWYSQRVQAQLMPNLPQSGFSRLTVGAFQMEQPTDTIPTAPAPANIEIEEELPSMLPPLGELPPMPPLMGFEEEVEMDIGFAPDIEIEIADFEISLLDMEELTAFSQIEMPHVFMEMDQFKIFIKDLNLQLDDTTRERIRKALEEQREMLELAKVEQTEVLEKAREELRNSLEADRPEELTDKEWEMAKDQIRQAERSLERAMQQSERVLEQALLGQEYQLHRHLDRVRDMDQLMIHKHIERFEHVQERVQHDQTRMKDLARTFHGKAQVQRDMARTFHGNALKFQETARVRRYGDMDDFRREGRHIGKESHLRYTLLQDGLIDGYDSDISLIFKKDMIKINGNKLEGSQKDKYRKLLDDIYGVNSRGEFSITINN